MSRETRLYALFEKKRDTTTGKERWERIGNGRAYRKSTAIRIYQTQLINSFMAGIHVELRPVKDNGGV